MTEQSPTQMRRPSRAKLLLGVIVAIVAGTLLGLLVWPPLLAFVAGIPIGVRVAQVQTSRLGAAVGAVPGAVIAVLLVLRQPDEIPADAMIVAIACAPPLGAAIGAVIGAVAARVLRALSGGATFLP